MYKVLRVPHFNCFIPLLPNVSVPVRLDSSLVALQGALQVLLRPETEHI